MKNNWEEKKFNDCIEKIQYTTKILKKDFLEQGKYPIISQEEDYINGYWNNKEDSFKITKPVIIFGDHTKKIKYIDFDFVLGADGVKILQPIDKIDTKFFYYALLNTKIRDLGYARHFKLLQEKNILLPPLQEQKEIVKKLDKAFADIDKLIKIAKQNLENSKELFNSYLNKVFTKNNNNWEEKTLNGVCEIQPNKDSIKHLKMNMLVSFVPMNDLGINSKYFKVNETKKLGEVIKQYTFFIYYDVLLAKITPCFENGKLGIAKNLSNKIGFGSSEYIVFRTKECINNEFLYYFLLQDKFRKEGIQNMYGAVGHKRVSINFIYNYKIKLPPLPQQKQIVKKLDNLQEKTKKLEEIYNKKIELAKELKQSVLHKELQPSKV